MTSAECALAQQKYGPGATDTEITIGNTMPYSGPASSYSNIGKAEAAYLNMVNEAGGVNGRKMKFKGSAWQRFGDIIRADVGE